MSASSAGITLLSSYLIELHYLRATHYCAVAAITLLLYDYILCFPVELRYIWQARWNFGKLLYVLNRYIPTFDLIIHLNTFLYPNPSQPFCLHWFRIDVVLSWFSLAIIELLLTLRTIALYEKNGLVSISLSLIAILTMFVLLVLIIVICIRINVSVYPISVPSVLTGCYYTEDTRILAGVWICPIIFETAVCVLTVTKAIQHLHQKTLAHSPLFTAFYRDGFLYFFFIFTLALINLIVWFAVPQALGQLLVMIYRSSMCILASRVILHLRQTGAKLSCRRTETQKVSVSVGAWLDRIDKWGEEGAFSHVSRLSTFRAQCDAFEGEGSLELGDRRRLTLSQDSTRLPLYSSSMPKRSTMPSRSTRPEVDSARLNSPSCKRTKYKVETGIIKSGKRKANDEQESLNELDTIDMADVMMQLSQNLPPQQRNSRPRTSSHTSMSKPSPRLLQHHGVEDEAPVIPSVSRKPTSHVNTLVGMPPLASPSSPYTENKDFLERDRWRG